MSLVRTNGIELFVVDEGDGAGGGPPVVLCHGFPELSYSWRHQIPALAAAGHRVLAPDQRGYGRSSRPTEVTDYDIEHLTGDLLGLLDAVGAERGVFVGHDWGAIQVWSLALRAPERVAGVVGMSVPFAPRGPMPPVQMMRELLGDAFFYVTYFQEPGVADAELAADPARFLRRMMSAGHGLDDAARAAAVTAMFAPGPAGLAERLPEPEGLPPWLAQEDLDHYVTEFTRSGFTGGINWYRNLDRNWERSAHLVDAKVEAPSLFIGGTNDPVLLMVPVSGMDGHLVDHRGTVLVDGAGHWVQQERPDEVNAALLEFLSDL